MQHKAIIVAAAAVMIGGSAACSPGQTAKPNPGTLPPGTAQFTIGGKELAKTTAQCAPAEQYLTTITAGGDAWNVTVMVSSADGLSVEFVRIRNLDGFSGDYNRGLGNDATIAQTQNTYGITGSASGYSTQSPEPTTEPFTMRVAC